MLVNFYWLAPDDFLSERTSWLKRRIMDDEKVIISLFYDEKSMRKCKAYLYLGKIQSCRPFWFQLLFPHIHSGSENCLHLHWTLDSGPGDIVIGLCLYLVYGLWVVSWPELISHNYWRGGVEAIQTNYQLVTKSYLWPFSMIVLKKNKK